MLSAEKENEPELKKSRFISVVVVLFAVFTVWGLITGIQKVWFYYDPRFAFSVQLMFWENILFPLLTLLWSIFCIIRKKKRECFIAGLLICSVLNAFTAASVAALTNKYYHEKKVYTHADVHYKNMVGSESQNISTQHQNPYNSAEAQSNPYNAEKTQPNSYNASNMQPSSYDATKSQTGTEQLNHMPDGYFEKTDSENENTEINKSLY